MKSPFCTTVLPPFEVERVLPKTSAGPPVLLTSRLNEIEEPLYPESQSCSFDWYPAGAVSDVWLINTRPSESIRIFSVVDPAFTLVPKARYAAWFPDVPFSFPAKSEA